MTDSLGCSPHKLHHDQELACAGMRLYRKRTADAALGHVATSASDRGHLVGVSLRPGHRRRILHAHHAASHGVDAGAVYIRGFADDYRADMQGAFDFVLLELSPAFLARAAAESGRRPGAVLTGVTGQADPVLGHLARAVLPALARPQESSTLFMEQLATAMATHLLDRYASTPARTGARTQRLSALHERRAKDMLREGIEGDLSVQDLAEACQLSRSHFIRAFSASTGQTPHRWLQAQRVDRAKALLREVPPLPLAQVANACGFADQSHFTRVFTRAEGLPPGAWRRRLPA